MKKSTLPTVKKRAAQLAVKGTQKNLKKRTRVRNRARTVVTNVTTAKTSSAPDARRASVEVGQQLNVLKAIPVSMLTDGQALIGVVQSYITSALQRGYLAAAPNVNYPYWAGQYMLNILSTYVLGSAQLSTSVPYWFLCLCHAISPKEVPYQRGKISYSSTCPSPFPNLTGVIETGPTAFGRLWYEFIPNGSYLDGFPVGIAPAAYTPDGGQAAWAGLIQFMIDSDPVWRAKLTELVPTSTNTPWSRDVSYFALPLVTQGTGRASAGWGWQAQHEVPIHCPMLSVFGEQVGVASDSTNVSRYPNRVTEFSGDSLVLSGKMAGFYPERFWKSKTYDVFKAVDFLQFADVYAQALTNMLTYYANCPAYSTGLLAGKPPLSSLTCPLSLQEFQLLLRNDISQVFARTIGMTQSLSPASPPSDTSGTFVPYIYGATTVPLAYSGMLIPRVLLENIKGLVARTVHSKNGTDCTTWFPVLGQYNNDLLDPATYTVTITGDVPVTVPVFFSESAISRKRRNSKGETAWEPLTEVPINLIDGTAGGTVVFINDSSRLAALASLFNEWLSLYNSTIDPCVQYSTDAGVHVLESISFTRHWSPVSSFKKANDSEYVDMRMQKHKHLTSTVYSLRNIIGITAQSEPLSAVYQIQNNWILPINWSNLGISSSDQTFINRMANYAKEAYLNPNISATDGTSIASINSTYAARLTHAVNGSNSDWNTFFEEQDKLGNGGILSGLAAQFASSVFGPQVGSIANAVASVLPI